MPSSALQFDAYAFAQLHLLGLLSITHPEDGPQPSMRSDADTENNPLLAALAVPELLMANALCYLNEQIHQITPHPRDLDTFIDSIASLAHSKQIIRPGNAMMLSELQAQASAAVPSNSQTPLPATKRKAAKRSARRETLKSSPAQSTRATRSSTHGAALDVSSSAGRSASPTMSISTVSEAYPGSTAARAEESVDASARMADRLRRLLEDDIYKIANDGFDAVLDSMGEFAYLLGDADDPNNHSFLDRSSPLGMWCRRCMLTVKRLDFQQADVLVRDILTWSRIDGPVSAAPTEQVRFAAPAIKHKSVTSRSDPDHQFALFEAYVQADMAGDYAKSKAALTEFFDQPVIQYAGSKDKQRGMRQYALLDLASFHLRHSEYEAAETAALEGLRLARHASDLIAVNALTSLLGRVAHVNVQAAPPNPYPVVDMFEGIAGSHSVNPIGSQMSTKEDPGGHVPPSDHLFDIRVGVAEGVPLGNLTGNLLRAKALHYSSLTRRRNLSAKEKRRERKQAEAHGKDVNAVIDSQQRRLRWNRLDTLAWLSAAADLWERMGCSRLASAYATLAASACKRQLGDIDVSGGGAIAAACIQADILSRRGASEAGLYHLLRCVDSSQSTIETHNDAAVWQATMSVILRRQALSSDEHRLRVTADTSYRPVFTDFPIITSPHTSNQVLVSGFSAEVEWLLADVDTHLSQRNPGDALTLALRAVALSSAGEGQGLAKLNRSSHVALARCFLANKSPDRAILVLEESLCEALADRDAAAAADTAAVMGESILRLVQDAEGQLDESGVRAALSMSKLAIHFFCLAGRISQAKRCLVSLESVTNVRGTCAGAVKLMRSIIEAASSSAPTYSSMRDRISTLQQFQTVVSAEVAGRRSGLLA